MIKIRRESFLPQSYHNAHMFALHDLFRGIRLDDQAAARWCMWEGGVLEEHEAVGDRERV